MKTGSSGKSESTHFSYTNICFSFFVAQANIYFPVATVSTPHQVDKIHRARSSHIKHLQDPFISMGSLSICLKTLPLKPLGTETAYAHSTNDTAELIIYNKETASEGGEPLKEHNLIKNRSICSNYKLLLLGLSSNSSITLSTSSVYSDMYLMLWYHNIPCSVPYYWQYAAQAGQNRILTYLLVLDRWHAASVFSGSSAFGAMSSLILNKYEGGRATSSFITIVFPQPEIHFTLLQRFKACITSCNNF